MPEVRTKTLCRCAAEYRLSIGDGDDYRRAKRLLDIGKHPTFVGRDQVRSGAGNGGLLFAVHNGEDLAIAILNRSAVLQVFNTHPDHRGHGLGTAFIEYLMPNFVRATVQATSWFERLGYVRHGEPMVGRSGKLATQIMVRDRLFEFAGRLQRIRDLPGPVK